MRMTFSEKLLLCLGAGEPSAADFLPALRVGPESARRLICLLGSLSLICLTSCGEWSGDLGTDFADRILKSLWSWRLSPRHSHLFCSAGRRLEYGQASVLSTAAESLAGSLRRFRGLVDLMGDGEGSALGSLARCSWVRVLRSLCFLWGVRAADGIG